LFYSWHAIFVKIKNYLFHSGFFCNFNVVMIEPVLHFTSEYWRSALLALIPLLINFCLFIYIFFYFPHNKLTRLFYCFLIPLCLWQLTDLLCRLSADKETATYWFHLLSPALNVIPVIGLHFTILFVQKKNWLKSRALLFGIYLPAFVFLFFSYGGLIKFSMEPSSFWGWVARSTNDTIGLINALWIVLSSLTTLGLLLHFTFIRKPHDGNLAMQAKLVALGFTVPTLVSVITEFIFPFLLNIQPVPLLSSTLSVFSVCVLIALKKYELLSYAPQRAWDSILKNMKEGLLIVNNEDIIQFANEHFCFMTGYTEKELLNRKAAELLLEEGDRNRIDEKIWDRKHSVSEKYELCIRKKNGEQIWCMVSGTPFFDRQGHVIGSIGIHADITEKKRTELALMESESGLRVFIEESLLCIHLLNPVTKKIIYANRAFHNLLQFDEQDIREILVYDFISHSKENVDERIQEILSVRKINAGERQWKRKDGKIVHVLVSSVCIRRQGKDVVYIAAQDISDSKELEKSLTQKIRDLNIFIYQVSHDIKGPLSSILGLSNIALAETTNPVQRNYFSMISHSTKRLDNTLNALLDIIVITQGKLKYQPIDINQEIKEIKRNLAYLPNYLKVNFNESIELNGQLVADKAMLITILQNLMANAINYADLRNEQPFVNFYTVQVKEHIKIVIEDNGVGIPRNLQDKIWDMFFRATELSKGTGLGLFIVRNAVERLNGDIILQSEPGVGTRFIVTIPAYPEYAIAN